MLCGHLAMLHQSPFEKPNLVEFIFYQMQLRIHIAEESIAIIMQAKSYYFLYIFFLIQSF